MGMTEDAILLGSNCLFLTLAHQADWLEFPIPNKFFLTKSINQVCHEATGITSLNLPEWVLCGVKLILPFFGYWPMDYLFITRIWILLWSCMWACDFLDFSWTLFIFPSVKGKRFRPGPLPQLHQAANRLMELGFRGFGIVLSGSVMIPMIFRSLTTTQYQNKEIYLNALYSKGFEHYNATETILNETDPNCAPAMNPFEDCNRYKQVQYSLMREIHDVKKVPEFNMTRRDSYNDLFQAVDGAILLYCVFIFSMTIFYHMMLEYAKWSSFKIREFHVIVQKAVLFAPYSRYSWKKRSTTTDTKYRTVYIGMQLASIPLVFGLLSFSLMDLDYSDFADSDGSSLSSSQLWNKILLSSGYPGGIFNYSSKYFHYYLQTNIQFVTLLPAALFFLTFTISVNVYFKLLAKIRNYEFSLYRTKYSKMYGSYR